MLVHGAPSDHTTFDPLVQALRGDVTTFAMDRRGSGASGDIAPYAIEREFEDVAAVVDEVAARSGGPVALWGHSYGCNPAMGGAALTANVRHLILYEPSFGLAYPPGAIEAIEAAVAAGDREAAIRAAFVDTDVMTDEEFEGLQGGPRWPKVLAVAPHPAPRVPGRAQLGVPPGPVRRDRSAHAPTHRLRHRRRARRADIRAAAAILERADPGARRARPLRLPDDPALVAAIIRDWVTS